MELSEKTFFENIPQELKNLNQWVVWGVNKNNLKCPYKPTNIHKTARTDDPSTWSNFFEARNAVLSGIAQGIGFEFNDNGIYGIDLDKVFIDGKLTPEAAEIVETLNSYTEISPSGKGLHILVKADNMAFIDKRKGFIEIYNKERYFTITGNIYNGLKNIESRMDELKYVYDKYLKRPEVQEAEPPKLFRSE